MSRNPIRVPPAAAQDRLLAPRARIPSRLGAHPSGLAPFIPEQTVQEQACRRCYPFLRE